MYISMAATCFLIAAALLIFQAGRFRRDGVIQWTLGYAFQGVFLTLIGLRGIIWDFLSIVVAHGLLAASLSLCYAAVREFQNRPYSRLFLFLPMIATWIYFWFFWAYQDSMFLRTVFIALLSSIQMAAIAWILFRNAPLQIRRSQWFTGCFFAVGSLLWLVRLFEVFVFPPYQAQILGKTWLRAGTLSSGSGLVILTGIGVLLMIRERAGEELRESEERFRKLADATFEGILIHDKGEILDINQAMIKMTGYDYHEVVGRNAMDFIPPESRARILPLMQTTYDHSLEITVERKDGTPLVMEVHGRPFLYKGKMVRVVALRDITERKKMEDEIRALAITDPLTGLFNRRGFLTMAEQQMKVAERTKKGLLLVFTDLDDLKQINDTWGHMKGDEALVEVANILKDTFREVDILARIGGDEFAVLAMEASQEDASRLSDRLQQQLDLRNAEGKREYRLALSTGTAYCDPEHPVSLDNLLDLADQEMYLHKRNPPDPEPHLKNS